MKIMERRLRKLEGRLASTADTPFLLVLRKRVEAGLRRLKESQENGSYERPEPAPHRESHRRGLVEALRLRV